MCVVDFVLYLIYIGDLLGRMTKKIIIGTYAMASEGLDIKTLTTLLMATPKTDVCQSVGRILRSKHKTPLVIDIIDKDNIHTGFDYRTFLRHRLKFADFNVANYWLHNKPRYKFDFGSFYTDENFPYFYPLQKMVEKAKSIEFEKII